MKTEAQLIEEKKKIQAQLSRIEAKRKTAENAKHVGKCFKYRNSYGPNEKWWLYMKVTKGGYWMEGVTFQITTTKAHEVKVEKCLSLMGGYIPISLAEYNAAKKKFAKRTTAILP